VVYLLGEKDLGRWVDVHVPDLADSERFIQKLGFISGYDEEFIYIKYPHMAVSQAEMPEWIFWSNNSVLEADNGFRQDKKTIQ
jgi:hypothetical protein